MWKRLTAISALAAAISGAPAIAQQSGQDQAAPPAATDQPSMPSEQPQANQPDAGMDLEGSKVTSSDGVELGKVAKVNTAADGKVENIHVEIGSTLGIGGKTVQLFPDQYTETENGIELLLTAEAAESLPDIKSQ